jgi:hypothetical protein
MNLSESKQIYRENGIVTFDEIIPRTVVEEMKERLLDVFAGRYRSGLTPKYRTCSAEESGQKICRVSFPRMSDPDIWNLLQRTRFPELAELITSRLVHGSGVCEGAKPRITIVLHLRSNRNRLRVDPFVQPRKEYSFSFRNLREYPIVYGNAGLYRD